MISDILREAGERMSQAVAAAGVELAAIGAGRADAASFAKVMVVHRGGLVPLEQLASLVVDEGHTVVVTPFRRGALPSIDRAVRDHLTLSASNDGSAIRITLEQVTGQGRRDSVRAAGRRAQNAKAALIVIRRDTRTRLDKFLTDARVDDDAARRAHDDLDDLTASHVNAVEEMLNRKQGELLE